MERVYLDGGGRIRRYFYPSKCRVISGKLSGVLAEDLYITPSGHYVVHTRSIGKWYEIDQNEAGFWLYRNGVNTIEVEI